MTQLQRLEKHGCYMDDQRPPNRDSALLLRVCHAGPIVVAGLFILTSSSQTQAESVSSEPLLLYASNVSKAAIEPLVPICARAAGTEDLGTVYCRNLDSGRDQKCRQ